jgi:hypothetical protein
MDELRWDGLVTFESRIDGAIVGALQGQVRHRLACDLSPVGAGSAVGVGFAAGAGALGDRPRTMTEGAA